VIRRLRLRERMRDRDTAVYGILLIVALIWPLATIYATDGTFLVTQAGHAGTWVLLAIGLNVVVGFAGLLDLGYAAFFAIGAYTYALFASDQLGSSPAHHSFHLPFWVMIFAAMFVAAAFGAILGFPTLRLRGDYLAIVTLGFGEIIPQFFTNGNNIFGHNLTNGVQGILPVDNIGTGPFQVLPYVPASLGPFDAPYRFVIFCALAAFCVFVSLRIRTGRLGRAWLAIREDEHDGHSADAHEAFRLRRWRFLRRRRGRCVRDPHQRCDRRPVQLLDLRHHSRNGGAGRHGQRVGRDPRRARPRLDQLDRHDPVRQ